MARVETVDAANREPDAVEDHRLELPHLLEKGDEFLLVDVAGAMVRTTIGPAGVRNDFEVIELVVVTIDQLSQWSLKGDAHTQGRRITCFRRGRRTRD